MKPKDITPGEPPSPAPEEAAPGNVFAMTLASIDKGAALAELSASLTEVVQAVRATGKRGELAYKLVIQPVPNTDGAQVICADELKVKIPKPDRKATLFFTTEEGGLSRKDPHQRDWIDEVEAREAAERAKRQELEAKVARGEREAAQGR